MHTIRNGRTVIVLAMASAIATAWQPNFAKSQEKTGMTKDMMGTGLMLPTMDPASGKQLFASKGCVVCHSVNGVGGEDAPQLDASTMSLPMNPFEFAARMWRGAEAMVAMQREELGEPINLTGSELADIIAFVHDAEAQAQFSEKDIPERIKSLMGEMD